MDARIVRAKLALLKSAAVTESRPVGDWQGRLARQRAPGDYEILGDWRPVSALSRWPALHTVFLQTSASAPRGWAAAETFLTFSFEAMEGLLSLDGKPWAGLDFGHQRVPLPARGRHELLLEFQSVPQAFWEPGQRAAEGAFRGARWERLDAEIEGAYYDLRFAFETINAIADERRKTRLGAALDEALLAIDHTVPQATLRRDVMAARVRFAKRLAAIAPDPEGGRLFLTGHTHIDTAWLWPLKESVRKCSRTFATACRLMERFPNYRFACSQAQLFAYTKQYYPDLYQDIRRWVAAGRWETTGAMWVEADANVTSGESLIRQILYGLRFFKDEFGTRPTVCWLPDVFGYNAGLPQILTGCGVRSFWTWKLHWQSRDPFPHHLFWWEGVDGSRVLAHIPKLGGGAYNGTPSPEQLARAAEASLQKGGYEEQLFPFGYGDGGGGVTEEMMQFADRAARYPGLPACRQGTVEQFFAEVHAAKPELPVWVGELYLQTHRGTYTTQGRTKRGNRLCELALREAEIWGTLGLWQGGDGGPAAGTVKTLAESLRGGWETTLLHQFHDILPGSSIGEVYADTAQDHARVLDQARQVRDQGLLALAGPVADSAAVQRVFNALSWDRQDVVYVTMPDPGPSAVAVCGSETVPAQVVARSAGMATVAVIVPVVPGLGAADITIRKGRPPKTPLKASRQVLENSFYRLELGPDGTLTRLFDKRAEREVIAAGETANRLQLFQDGPEHEAAWNIHASYTQREYAWDGPGSVNIVEQGPVRAVARVLRTRRETTVQQDIILYNGLPRIDFQTRVEWRERQTLLKVAFPLAVHASHATFEIQFGALERPNHRNTSWDEGKFEVCGLRWADLSEGGYGVSLLNDSKYGHDVLGNVLRLTLLRGTEFPDTEADQGAHEFTYSLLPHRGDWRAGQTVRRAAELNVPLLAVPAGAPQAPLSYLRVDGPAILETLKPAEDGDGIILRFYEPNGERGSVTVVATRPFHKALECNLVEENGAPIEAADGRFSFEITPYQIRTFRLRLRPGASPERGVETRSASTACA
jgi:alpha-mannosidase